MADTSSIRFGPRSSCLKMPWQHAPPPSSWPRPKKKVVGQTRRGGLIQEARNAVTSKTSKKLIEAESGALPEDEKKCGMGITSRSSLAGG